MRLRLSALFALLLLAACSGQSAEYPFPTSIPSSRELVANYQLSVNTESPLDPYRFRIYVPKSWVMLDVRMERELKEGELGDVAIYREPGDWQTSDSMGVKGEIAINVVNVEGVEDSPAQWLQATLRKNVKEFTVISKQTSPSSSGEVDDVLLRYRSGDQAIASRMMAMRRGDRMFVITCSDALENYPYNADACNVAIQTFRLAATPQ